VVLGSTKVSSRKIQDSGFKFQFPTLTVALRDLI
jgi:NAD dependent epimerase/dehydratase family enzyme